MLFYFQCVSTISFQRKLSISIFFNKNHCKSLRLFFRWKNSTKWLFLFLSLSNSLCADPFFCYALLHLIFYWRITSKREQRWVKLIWRKVKAVVCEDQQEALKTLPQDLSGTEQNWLKNWTINCLWKKHGLLPEGRISSLLDTK